MISLRRQWKGWWRSMKSGMTKGLLTGMLIGGSAAMIYGVMNWQTERQLNAKARQTGSWIASKAEDLTRKL